MANGERATYQEQGENRFVEKRRTNVKSDLIEITHDKLENILLKHLKNVNIKTSWVTPLTISLTVLLARLTADFKDYFDISKDVWDAFFLILFFASVIWFLWTVYRIIVCWKKSSIDHLINQIKNADDTDEQENE